MPESTLSERLHVVRDGIADAAADAGRDLADIALVVVTKFHPVSLLLELHGLGVHDFGESRHQEAQVKSVELADLGATWHFVGQLQSKKAAQVAGYSHVIHSIDRDSVVDALGRVDREAADIRSTDVFVQLNLTDDPARGGVADGDVERVVERVLGTAGLRLLGVMAVAPVGVEPRAAFAGVRAASERVRALHPPAAFISTGMSGDYREAILEGATHLRIGSAITGNRPTAG
ncbi:MAG: YggS family pyridoxal phosphate-dependent enzyme [Burkholderiaceae bacterium]|nr:YggS family pyridoxal phosphate-dependent enzyme [Microbacteriaceae bacterium]